MCKSMYIHTYTYNINLISAHTCTSIVFTQVGEFIASCPAQCVFSLFVLEVYFSIVQCFFDKLYTYTVNWEIFAVKIFGLM